MKILLERKEGYKRIATIQDNGWVIIEEKNAVDVSETKIRLMDIKRIYIKTLIEEVVRKAITED